MSFIQVDITSSSRYPIDRSLIRAVVAEVVEREHLTSELTVSILVVGSRKMRQFNREFHGEDYATDVLSFPYADPQSSQDHGLFVTPPDVAPVLGDIVVCYPVALLQAQEKQALVNEEIASLVEHGMLHLLGKHHD